MSEKPTKRPRTPWLIIGTILGAFIGFLIYPAGGGSSWQMEGDAWRMVLYPTTGAFIGLIIGLIVDVREQLQNRRAIKSERSKRRWPWVELAVLLLVAALLALILWPSTYHAREAAQATTSGV